MQASRLAIPALQLPRGLRWSTDDKIIPLHEKPEPPFWHDDGDIFLRTVDGKYFRLHRRFFTEQSKVFGEGFMVFQSLNFGEIAATSEVFEYLIEALYKPAWLAIHGSNFDIMVGLLRLTTKYEMSVLRSDIITLLKKKVIPCDCTTMIDRLNAVDKVPDKPPFGVTFSPLKMVALSREFNLPELFPPVVYMLLRALIRGWSREEGIQMEKMEKTDLIRLMAGQRIMLSRVLPLEKRSKRKNEDLSSRGYFRVRGLELKRSDACIETCPLAVESFLQHHWDERPQSVDHIRVFHEAKEYAKQEIRCLFCSRQLQHFFRSRRDALWSSIANDFVNSMEKSPREINPSRDPVGRSIVSSVTFMHLTQTTKS